MWAKVLQALFTVIITNVIVPLTKYLIERAKIAANKVKRKKTDDSKIKRIKDAKNKDDRIGGFSDIE